MAEISCRYFNGYKPCGRGLDCSSQCPEFSPVGERILIVHLEALGAVLRSTSLLAAVKRKYPRAQITWVTKAPAQALLQNLRGVDRVLTLGAEDLLKLSALEFDVALVIDKSLVASGVLRQTSAKQVFGFRAGSGGEILPVNRGADELWNIGLSDQKKFFENQKSEQQLVHEALELGEFKRDEYSVQLSPQELELARARRQIWRVSDLPIIGINTGCSATLPNKKLSVEGHRELIRRIRTNAELHRHPIVLLGGPEDKERGEAIAHGLEVIISPTSRGLRDGLVSVEACDVVFSGDSLGMHMAIGLKKWVVAWFGPSCAAEIDLYDRGRKIMTEAPCSPCWKRDCQKPKMCYDQLDFSKVLQAINEGIQWHISCSKPHIPEISFSPSP
jgi:heptosyltransferase-2